MMTTIILGRLPPFSTRLHLKGWAYQSPGCGLSALCRNDHTGTKFAPFTGVKYREKKEIVKIQSYDNNFISFYYLNNRKKCQNCVLLPLSKNNQLFC
jgi:hypothetical protein